MSKHDADFWDKAVDARNELLYRVMPTIPDVKYVDIGYPPTDGKDASDVSLRVHVAEGGHATDPNAGIQQSVGGIPVCVMRDGEGKKITCRP